MIRKMDIVVDKVDDICEKFEMEGLHSHPTYKQFKRLFGELTELRAVLAQEAGKCEPIYQVRYLGDGGGGWSDVEKDEFDLDKHHKNYHTRTVYASPPAPVAVNGWTNPCVEEGHNRQSVEFPNNGGTINWCIECNKAWMTQVCLDKVKELNQ